MRMLVQGDFQKLKTKVVSDANKHWDYAEREHAILKRTNKVLKLDLRKKHRYFLWPYVDMAFAKLAVISGAQVEEDSFWLPAEFANFRG